MRLTISKFCKSKILLFLLFIFSRIDARSSRESTHYEAVVVEFAADGHPVRESALQLISRNWAAYSSFIAGAEGADIIVFPECGLTTTGLPAAREHLRPFLSRVPDPATRPVPCDEQPRADDGATQVLRNASCAARRHAIYVVLNLPEEYPCAGENKCPQDGIFIYNTNVAFDRNGTLVARYRKFHLFVEPGFNTPPKAEMAVFETDFGVRFATFICFDILFEVPPLRLVREMGITDIAYSTAWFSELPFLTAVQTQAGWAHGTNVTLLASGLDRPENSNTGSGIYWGEKGVLEAAMHQDLGSSALRTRVLKRRPSARTSKPVCEAFNRNTQADDRFFLTLPSHPLVENNKLGHLKLLQDDLRAWATVLLPPAGGTFNTTLCHGMLCCHVKTEAIVPPPPSSGGTATRHYFYRAAAFDGMRFFSTRLAAGVQACAVIACLDEATVTSCGRVEHERAAGLHFQRIALSAHGFRRHHALQVPSTLEAETLLPLRASLFRFGVQSANETAATVSAFAVADLPLDVSLLAFGVYGRVFDRDKPIASALPQPTIIPTADTFNPSIVMAPVPDTSGK